jgi:hypothetical protein
VVSGALLRGCYAAPQDEVVNRMEEELTGPLG